jgi:DNA-binding CsgD family transcriptional regulator
VASTVFHLAVAAVELGDYASAGPGFQRSLVLNWELGFLQGLSPPLEGLAMVALQQALPERAAHLLAAAQTLRESIAGPLAPADRDDYDRALAEVREALGEEAFAEAWRAARGLSIEQAVELGSQPTVMAQAPPADLPHGAAEPDLLTPREREVLLLVARGHSNREIAELLVVSVRTTEAHMTHLLTKLGLRSRAQLVVWAAERGMLATAGHESQAGSATSRPRPAKPTR